MNIPTRQIRFTLNGRPASASVAPHHTLVELLNEQGLTGARESCGQGLCGCCTVLLDGVAVTGCLTLGLLAEGKTIETVEHLDQEGEISPVQQAFIETGAFQCGFCTPGFVLMVEQLLDQRTDPTEHEIRDYLSGNLCRCATYPEIIAAVRLAASLRKTKVPT